MCQAFLKMSQNNRNISPGFLLGLVWYVDPAMFIYCRDGRDGNCVILSLFIEKIFRVLCTFRVGIIQMMLLLPNKLSELLTTPWMIHWWYISFFRLWWSVIHVYRF